VRYFFEMQRPLDGDLPDVSLPAGLAFRPALPEHYRAIWSGRGMLSRPMEHVALSDEDYNAWVATPDLDPSLWLVAWEGDQIAGAAINVTHKSKCGQPDTWGETDDLFVRRPWRQRGLGRALLAGSMRLFKARGLVTAGLGVDAENLSGALRLYEGLAIAPYQRVSCTASRCNLAHLSWCFISQMYTGA